MRDFTFARRVALGDAIVMMSVLAAQDEARVYVHNKSAQFEFVREWFSDQLEHVTWLPSPIRMEQDRVEAIALAERIPLIRCNKGITKGNYVTVQRMSPNRDLTGYPNWEIKDDRDIVDIDKNNSSLEWLFETVGAAQKHYGIDSGCTWLAGAMGVPVEYNCKRTAHWEFPRYFMRYSGAEYTITEDMSPNTKGERYEQVSRPGGHSSK